MISTIYIDSMGASVLGVLSHIIIKMRMSKKRSDAAKLPFTIVGFIYREWINILWAILAASIMVFVLPEILNIRPTLANKIRILYVFVGYAASSWVFAALSKTEKRGLKEIDKITHIATGDKTTPDDLK